MDYQQALAVLKDLPSTFTRFGNTYQSILQAFTAASARSTIAIDALTPNIFLPTANWGWLDGVGRMFGVPRQPYETDPAYRLRISAQLTAPHVTPTAMANFIELVLGISVIISEDLTNTAYSIQLLQPVSNTTLQNIVNALVWVRPAGVPFLPVSVLFGGLILNTLNYFGTKRVTGSYLVTSVNESSITTSDTTPAPNGLLPTVYLTDPMLTGVVSLKNPFLPLSPAVTTPLFTLP